MAEPEVIEQTPPQETGGIEVDITPQTTGTNPPPAVTQAQEPPPPPAVGVEELQRQLKAMGDREAAALRERSNMEKIAREQADRLAIAQEDAARARGEVADTRKGSIDSSIIAAQTISDMARRDYQLALEAGDFGKAADANQKLIQAAAQVATLEEKKRSFAETAPRPFEGAVRPQAAPANDVETYIRTKTPRTQEWLRAHPEAVTDPRLNHKTVAAHHDALAEGYGPDTDGYFDFIDRKLGFAGQLIDAQPEPDPAPRRPQPKAPPPAAPVSRDSPRSENSNRMYLTRGELETAEALGMTPAEYGRRKQQMAKSGFYHT